MSQTNDQGPPQSEPQASPTSGVLIVDASGRIRHANAAASALINRKGEPLVGQEFGLPLGDDLRQTIEVIGSDGAVCNAEMRVAPYTVADPFTGVGAWAVTIRPLTYGSPDASPTRLETATPRGPRAAGSDDGRMDDALSLTYHELGNAVAGITAGLTMLRDSWAMQSEEDRLARVVRLERAASGLAVHLKGYLDADRAEAGVFEPRPAVNELLDLVLERLPDLGSAAAHVVVDIPSSCLVVVDDAHCWSIVGNFVNNALKHGDPPVQISATTSGGQTTIKVSDHGEGVPPERVPHLFERFTHGGEAASNGLGLWIAATLAEAYGGQVWWEPNEPTGSRFCCRLPAVAAR